jgi:hypothetical protein
MIVDVSVLSEVPEQATSIGGNSRFANRWRDVDGRMQPACMEAAAGGLIGRVGAIREGSHSLAVDGLGMVEVPIKRGEFFVL